MQDFLTPNRVPKQQDVTDALKDFGFYHHLADVCRMYAEYVNHGRYGYSGGVMDQPDVYWQDMNIMKHLELWAKHFAPLVGMVEEVSIFDKLRQGLPAFDIMGATTDTTH